MISYANEGNRAGLIDIAARITGGVLALGSVLITAPIMFAVQAYMINREDAAGRSDLESREYRDGAGRTHHHTRTFMRDHGSEVDTLAA